MILSSFHGKKWPGLVLSFLATPAILWLRCVAGLCNATVLIRWDIFIDKEAKRKHEENVIRAYREDKL